MDRDAIIKKATEKIKEILAQKKLEAEQDTLEAEDSANEARLALQLASTEAIIDAINANRMPIEDLAKAFSESIKEVKVEIPPIKIPPIKVPEAKVTVKIPEIKLPTINVPEPKVTVNIPEQKAPIVNIPEMVFPDFPSAMDVGLDRFTTKTPMPVMTVGPDGKFVSPLAGGGGASGAPQLKEIITNTTLSKKNTGNSALDIPLGNIPGCTALNKFGHSNNVDSGVKTDIWDRANTVETQAIWVAPTQARTHIIHSRSITDTSGGTGARTLKVYGLKDWDTKEISETVTMAGNASTAVTSNSYVIIHRMKVVTKGGTAVNAGVITATATTDATVTAQINELEGQTQMAIYGIPSCQDFYMTDHYASLLRAVGATAGTDITVKFNPEPKAELKNFLVKHTGARVTAGTSSGAHQYVPYNKFEGPGILKIQATGSADNLDVSAGFDGILVDH